jgi:hypothetical protein
MSSEEIIVKELIKALDIGIFWLAVQLSFIAIFALVAKGILEGIVAYVFYRMDKYVCLGTLVKINGNVGRIRATSWNTIVIETDDDYMRIPMTAWKTCQPIVLRNQVELKKE